MLRGIPPAETEKNLSAILAKLKAAHVRVLLTGMKAQANLGPDYVRQFDAIYPRLAKQYGVLFYPFMLQGVALNPKLNQADGLHPNPAGVKVIVAHMLPLVKKLVSGLAAHSAPPHPQRGPRP
jgi:acyl-CoA thioesterase-1